MKIAVVCFSVAGIGAIEAPALAAGRLVVCARVRRMERLVKPGRNKRLSECGGARDVTAPRRRIVERPDVWRQLRSASGSVKSFAEVVRA
ncbi:hypothetical protein HRbin10_00150 [bacterium HR10]|nr:hypothetical protein HRbin10_00150 [bacterium HR10]